MLFISSEKSDKNSFYVNLLSKNLRLEEFKNVQIVNVNEASKNALNLETLPLYLTKEGDKVVSIQEITRHLTNMVNLTPLLIGLDNNESSSSLKWMDLDFNFG